MEDFGRKISVGILWSLIGFILGRGASSGFVLLLALFLVPEDFGLVAIVMVAVEVSNAVVQSGLGQALIRKTAVTQVELSTVFYFNLLVSLLLMVALAMLAPIVAEFYDQPKLEALLTVISLVLPINAMKVVQVAILSREMNFEAQARAGLIGVVVSGISAVICAAYNAGVWSLVVQVIGNAGISALVLWLITKWRPSLTFKLGPLKEMLGFGMYLLVESVLDNLARNSQLLALGKFLGAEFAGLYFIAKKISDLVSLQYSFAIQQATYPALSTLKNNGFELRAKYRKILKVTMFVYLPALLILFALAKPSVELFLGDDWYPVVRYIQLLSLVCILHPVHAMNINVLKVVGRSDLIFKIGLIKKAGVVTALILTLPHGVEWVIVGQLFSSIFGLIPNTYYTSKLIGYTIADQVLDIAKPIGSAVISGVAIFYIQLLSFSQLETALYGVLVGVCLYSGLNVLMRAEGINIARQSLKLLLEREAGSEK